MIVVPESASSATTVVAMVRMTKPSAFNHLQTSLGGARVETQQPVKSDPDDLLCNLLLCESAVLPEPARKPINHSQKAESCHRCIDVVQPPLRLELIQQVPQA